MDINCTNKTYFNDNCSDCTIEKLSDIDVKFLTSFRILEESRKINIFSTIILILFGLVGNSLIIFVFAQKRFRTNSSNIYLLCLAINDSLFLIIHFIEDTVKNYQRIFIFKDEIVLKRNNATSLLLSSFKNDTYKSSDNLVLSFMNNIITTLNITDKHDISCRLINYLRYVLRFISAYIIVAFTIQRLIIVSRPLSKKFISKNSAWKTVILILIVALLINLWVPFIFKLNTQSENSHCDTDEKWNLHYMVLTIFYVCLIMIIPTIIIFICNAIITYFSYRADSQRKTLNKMKTLKKDDSSIRLKKKNLNRLFNTDMSSKKAKKKVTYSKSIMDKISTDFIVKPYYLNINHIIKRISRKANSTRKLTRILLFISFSYAFFNLPYFIAWFLFYFYVFLNQTDDETFQNYLIASVKLFEFFYVLNYAVNFYIYCASGSIFRNQLRYSVYTPKSNHFKVEYYLERKGHESNRKFLIE